MPDNQEEAAVQAELEAEANEMMGGAGQQSEAVQSESAEESHSEASTEATASEETEAPVAEGQSEEISDEELSLLKEWRALQAIEGTPYKSVAELVKGYKNVQGEFTKTREKTKPYEAVLTRMEREPQFRTLVEQLQQMVDNPGLLNAYAQKVAPGDPRPLPTQYDVYTPEGLKQYEEAMDSWTQRQLDSRINARLGGIEEQARLRSYAAEFKQRFPDVTDPDQYLSWAREEGVRMNPYEAAYRLREWDNLPAKLEERIRKELTQKVQEAGKTQTPQGQAPPVKKITPDDILKTIDTLGIDEARKKYGKERVTRALAVDAEAFMRS